MQAYSVDYIYRLCHTVLVLDYINLFIIFNLY